MRTACVALQTVVSVRSMSLPKSRSAAAAPRGVTAWRVAAGMAVCVVVWEVLQRRRVAPMRSGAGVILGFGDGEADEWHTAEEKAAIMKRLRAVLRVCGALCDTTRETVEGPFMTGTDAGLHFRVSRADVPCRGLYSTKEVDTGRETASAPKKIPKELTEYFTMNGKVQLVEQYHDQKYLGEKERVLRWDEDMVERLMKEAKNGTLRGNYGVAKTVRLFDSLKNLDLPGKRVLVIGSESPWVEACALAAGADEVVTLEYSQIDVRHPRQIAMLPRDFAARYLNGTLGDFDVVVSFSSLEHPGLARYGDSLNPWGDIIAVAKAWCVTKPGGKFIMEVPYASKDQVVFNAHRVYGPIRSPYQMTNWQQAVSSSAMMNARVYDRLDARVV